MSTNTQADVVPSILTLKLRSNPQIPTVFHEKATTILATYRTTPDPSLTALPSTLRTLLLDIIKPLFTNNPHPSLAPSGRRAHFSPAPTFPHSQPLILDDSDKPWKLCFDTLTSPLLCAILDSYASLRTEARQAAIEEHIFLLTPALLNILDDSATHVKVVGYELVRQLSEIITSTGSEILHRSGLVDVFIKAMESDFMLLPTLTPEDESVQILNALYPAILALITAEFPHLPPAPTTVAELAAQQTLQPPPTTKPTPTKPKKPHPSTIRLSRQHHLLTHALLPSFTHLSAGISTTHPLLVTLLLHHLTTLLTHMAIHAAPHLQTLLPLLRSIIVEPFALAAPGMVVAALGCLKALIGGNAERVRERWWGEVLRGVVGGWCAVLDEVEEEVGDGNSVLARDKLEMLEEVKRSLKDVIRVLGTVVKGEEWEEARTRLCEEEGGLVELFTPENNGNEVA